MFITLRGTLVLAAAIVVGACTSGTPELNAPRSVVDVAPVVRECESAVFGHVNMKKTMSIGPLLLVGTPEAANLPRRAFKPHHGRYSAVKVLAVVKGSNDVTVTLPTSLRDSVFLLYDPDARANRYGFKFAAGDPRVTFGACPPTRAQYNGGFISTQPRCVRLLVTSEEETRTGWISLGAGPSCPA